MNSNQKILCASACVALITFTINAQSVFVSGMRGVAFVLLIFVLTLPLMGLSFAIETLIFWLIQPRTSFDQACGMSLLGNFAGSFAAALSVFIGALFAEDWVMEFSLSIPVFYLANVIAQLFAINVVFKYSFRQLFIPVVLGHALADIIFFPYFMAKIMSDLMFDLKHLIT